MLSRDADTYTQAGDSQSILSPFPLASFTQFASPQSRPPDLRGVINIEKFAELTDAAIIKQVVDRKSESARQRELLEPDWRYLENLYRQQQGDRRGKQKWQSALVFQEVFNKVETAVSMFKSALLDQPEWFKFRRRLPNSDETQVRFIQRVMEIVIDDADFIDQYVLCLKDALLLGSGCIFLSWDQWADTTPHWEQVPITDQFGQPMFDPYGQPMMRRAVSSEPRPRSGLRCQYIPIWSAFPDPCFDEPQKGKFFLHEFEIDRADVLDSIAVGKYREQVLEDLGEPINTDYSSEHRYRLTRTPDSRSDSKRKRDAGLLYWGDLTDPETGEVIAKNWRVCVLNERVIAQVGPNPYWSGFFPYVWSSPIPWPGRPWGRSIALAAANKQEGVTKLANLMVDDFMYSVLKAFQIDTTAMPSLGSSDISSIEPGKTYKGRGQEFIKQIGPFVSQAQSGYPLITFLRQSIADDMRISEFQEGSPTSRGRPTKYEIQTKSGRGDAIITNMSRDLERHDLEPFLRHAFEIYWQFGGDLGNPALKELVQAWAGPVEFLSDDLRLQMLDAEFEIEARGISGVFQRDELFGKISEAAPILQSMMPPPQTMVAMGYLLIQSLGIDPEHHLMMPKSPMEFIQWQQQMMMQQQAQLANGGAPPPPGQARSAGPGGGGLSPGAPPPQQGMM